MDELNKTFELFKEEYSYDEMKMSFDEKILPNNYDFDYDDENDEDNLYNSTSDNEIADTFTNELIEKYELEYGDLIDSEKTHLQELILDFYDFLNVY